MYSRLSELTPDIIDDLYRTKDAKPTDKPLFVFLVGTPGAGKSSGHPPSLRGKDYATINLDTLLESLRPFRASSAAAWWMAHADSKSSARNFTGLPGYSSRRENVSSFGWWDRLTPKEREDAPDAIRHIMTKGIQPSQNNASLIKLNEAAIERAIRKSVNIIYETTLALNKKDGRVKKVDNIMTFIRDNAPQYHILFVLVEALAHNVVERITARQEFNMPYKGNPFWRRVPVDGASIEASIRNNAIAFSALEKQYGEREEVTFERIENKLDRERLPAVRDFDDKEALERINMAYGPKQMESGIARKSSGASHRSLNIPSLGSRLTKTTRKSKSNTRKSHSNTRKSHSNSRKSHSNTRKSHSNTRKSKCGAGV